MFSCTRCQEEPAANADFCERETIEKRTSIVDESGGVMSCEKDGIKVPAPVGANDSAVASAFGMASTNATTFTSPRAQRSVEGQQSLIDAPPILSALEAREESQKQLAIMQQQLQAMEHAQVIIAAFCHILPCIRPLPPVAADGVRWCPDALHRRKLFATGFPCCKWCCAIAQ